MKFLPRLLFVICLASALSAAPIGQPEEVKFCDAYTIRTYRDGVTGEGSFEILRGKAVVYEKAGFCFYIGRRPQSSNTDPLLIGQDLTKTGAPHVVVYEWTGGAHCCYIARVFRLGEKCELLAEVDGVHTNPVFRPDGENRPWLVSLRDWGSLDYWPQGFAAAHAPEVLLEWRQTRYVVAHARMRKPAPPALELEKLADKVRSEDSWLRQPVGYPYELYATALDLMYSGHEELGWKFLREAWRPGVAGLEKFAADLRERRDTSDYWQQLAKAP